VSTQALSHLEFGVKAKQEMDKQSIIVPQRNHLGINSVSYLFHLKIIILAFISKNTSTSIAIDCTRRIIYDNWDINKEGIRQYVTCLINIGKAFRARH